MSVLFKNGTVVTTTGRTTADVYAESGTIKAIGIRLDQKAEEVVDCKGKYILPGVIDPHTHMDMPFMGTSSQDDLKPAPLRLPAAG